MKYLLDTNACVTHLRGKNHLVRQRFALHPPGELVLCSVVVAELFYGAERSNNPPAGRSQVETFIAQFRSVPFDDDSVRVYGEVRHAVEVAGQPISENDYLIAAIALAHDLILVTHNTKEFNRVPGIQLEDWELP